MTYQEILQGIAQRRASTQFIPGAQIQLDDIWWALQALAEHGKEIEQTLLMTNQSITHMMLRPKEDQE